MCLSYGALFSQTEENELKNEIDKLNCTRKSNIALEKRFESFPYNLSSKIKITSYKNKEEGMIGDDLQKYLNFLILKKDISIENKFDEIIELNKLQIDELTDIIFNYGFKKHSDFREVADCYMPRNAVLFYDKENKIIGFIEICFECNNSRTNDKRISLGEECNQKYQLLKTFFKDCGIKYGVIEK